MAVKTLDSREKSRGKVFEVKIGEPWEGTCKFSFSKEIFLQSFLTVEINTDGKRLAATLGDMNLITGTGDPERPHMSLTLLGINEGGNKLTSTSAPRDAEEFQKQGMRSLAAGEFLYSLARAINVAEKNGNLTADEAHRIAGVVASYASVELIQAGRLWDQSGSSPEQQRNDLQGMLFTASQHLSGAVQLLASD